jgi:phage portal protein BeeE
MNILQSLSNLVTKEVGWNTFFSTEGKSSTKSNYELYFGTLYACIDTIATTISETQWKLARKKGKEWEEVTEHPLIDLFNTPNNYQTSHDLLYLLSSYIDTNGQAFLYPVKSGLNSKRVVQLHLLNPSYVSTKVNGSSVINEIMGYSYQKDGKTYPFKPEELINILRPSPFNQ